MKKIAVKILLTVLIVSVMSGATFSVRQGLTVGSVQEKTRAVECMQTCTETEQATVVTTAARKTTQPETVKAAETEPRSKPEAESTVKTEPRTARPAAQSTTVQAETTQPETEASVQTDGSAAGELKSLGRFKITFYCGGACCNGKWAGKTCTGNPMIEGRTIAVDKNVIPLGTSVYIEGFGWYVAEDVGGGVRGNHIDIYLADHDRVNRMGVQSAMVYLK